jgi:uridine kinase
MSNSPVTTVIAIVGPSGSGKTRLAEALAASNPNKSLVCSQDNYYHTHPHLSLGERQKLNYDHPDAHDHKLLIQHIKQLRQGKAVLQQQYSFVDFDRSQECITLIPKPMLIIEGILAMHWPELRDVIDIGLYLDTPFTQCIERRIQRDTTVRQRSLELVHYQIEQTLKPMTKAYVMPQKTYADLILPSSNADQMQAIINQVATRIAQKHAKVADA